jgi:hypothetical protein
MKIDRGGARPGRGGAGRARSQLGDRRVRRARTVGLDGERGARRRTPDGRDGELGRRRERERERGRSGRERARPFIERGEERERRRGRTVGHGPWPLTAINGGH